jgi:menaquinone-9 beta-reductase
VHDVAVIGAGPGGSATAHFLAQRGLDVLLLDRSQFPRDKTCGDGLTPRALRVLDAMGILREVASKGRPIDSYEVVAPNGKRTTSRTEALVVPRLTLDQIILERAVASGAQFRAGVTVDAIEPMAHGVNVKTRGESVTARLAVIATGAATGVLTRSGILRRAPRAMLAARAYFEGVSARKSFQLRFGGVPQPGYGWVFPMSSNAANIGVGFWPKRKQQTARAAFQRFVADLPYRQTSEMRGYPIRVDFLRARTFAPRTLLVGEAAGLVNPLTGEGIDYALESGQIAAELLAQEPFDPLRYHAVLHERFGKVFHFSEYVRDWYCKPVLLDRLVPLANRRPELRQLLTSIVLGEREPAGFGPLSMLARLLVYLVKTRPRTLGNTA